MARHRNVKICAVVHVLPGLKVVALVPLVIPSFTAQPMAALKGELSATSVKQGRFFRSILRRQLYPKMDTEAGDGSVDEAARHLAGKMTDGHGK